MPVTVNGETIRDADIEREIQRRRDAGEVPLDATGAADEGDLRARARDSLVNNLLLRQDARAAAEPVPREQVEQEYRNHVSDYAGVPREEALKAVEDLLRVRQFVRARFGGGAAPTDAELRRHYKERRDTFRPGEQIRLRHIVKRVGPGHDSAAAHVGILNAQEDLKRGVPFEQAVRRHSDDPARDGDLGWMDASRMPDAIGRAILTLKSGEISEVFRTEHGYHLAQVLERKPGAVQPYEKVRAQVAVLLRLERQAAAMQQYLDKRREQSAIVES